MQIVGAQQIIASDSDIKNLIRFYEGLFGRLIKEVKNTGNLTRYVGYQSVVSGKENLHFFGIEVDGIEDIPEGMVAWDLSDNIWTVRQAKDGQDVVISQKNISWRWIDKSPSGSGKCVGEFAVLSSAESITKENSEYRDFWISANAYVKPPEKDADNDEVHIVDYDPSWPQQFEEIAGWLRDYLGTEIALRVEHYGSTAIPNMPAKPIIDVLVEIPSFSEARQHVIPLLNSEKWEYWWYSDHMIHMIFIKREKLMGRRTHHIHMAPRGHRLWQGLTFRDYLISHDKEASRYATLKRELANSYRKDRERYTEAKTTFVNEIISKAL